MAQEITMVLDGEKLPELDEVDLETIFNEVKSEDLARPGDVWGVKRWPVGDWLTGRSELSHKQKVL